MADLARAIDQHPDDLGMSQAAPMRPAIGCDEAGAIRYMGCSRTMFEDLRARRIVVPVRKGYYSYRLLELAMSLLEEEALKAARVVTLFPAGDDERHRKGSPPEPTSTYDLLARLKGNGQT